MDPVWNANHLYKYICILIKLHVHTQLVFHKLWIIFPLYTTIIVAA